MATDLGRRINLLFEAAVARNPGSSTQVWLDHASPIGSTFDLKIRRNATQIPGPELVDSFKLT